MNFRGVAGYVCIIQYDIKDRDCEKQITKLTQIINYIGKLLSLKLSTKSGVKRAMVQLFQIQLQYYNICP